MQILTQAEFELVSGGIVEIHYEGNQARIVLKDGSIYTTIDKNGRRSSYTPTGIYNKEPYSSRMTEVSSASLVGYIETTYTQDATVYTILNNPR